MMNTHRSEEMIKEFHRMLCVSGMSRNTSLRHKDKLRFFLHAYLVEEWPRQIDRVDGEIIRDFLGAWFLRNVGGSKSDLAAYLSTFRRFYDYLYQSGRISEAEHDDLMTVCECRDYFCARYDEYFNPLPDAWEDFACGGPIKDDASIALGHEHHIDRQVWMLASNMDTEHTPAVLDFALFLDYAANVPIKLTQANAKIPRKHISRINQRFSTPEKIPSRKGMNASVRITWFFQMALDLGLATKNQRNVLELTPRAESYLDLEQDTQLALIIDATWNRLSWEELGSSEARRVSRWAQEHKDGFAALLSELPPEREWSLDPEPGVDRQDALLARYVLFHDVVERQIMFALKETGVIDYSTWNHSPGTLEVKSITVTRFGRQLMRLFTRRVSRELAHRQSPLARLQECLLI